MKILIAEDSALMRKAIGKTVVGTGFKMIEALNGAEALTLLRKNCTEIALIILDWNMPVMDGYEALLKIRANSGYDHIPVLMATSDGVEEDVIKAIKAGANSYLVKPFTLEQMTRQIEKLTGSSSVKTS